MARAGFGGPVFHGAVELAAAGAGNLITTVWGAGYRMDDQLAA